VALTSPQNSRLQEIRKAAKAGRPTPDGLIVAEGPHLLEEVLRSEWRAREIYGTGEALERFSGLLSKAQEAEVVEVAPRAFASIASTETTQGLLTLLRPRAWTWQEVTAEPALAVVLDAIQDPGNVGAIVRSSEAFGASGVVLGQGCARISNGKVLRAAAGSLFRLPVIEAVTRAEILRHLGALPVRFYALDAKAETPLQEAELRSACALLVGNEGAGISREMLAVSDAIRIPTVRVESLNAAVACSVALFEAARQRGAA